MHELLVRETVGEARFSGYKAARVWECKLARSCGYCMQNNTHEVEQHV